MNTRGFTLCMLVAASSATPPVSAFAACDARSGPKTAALVELYTSEGCSSCPPADEQLSRLRQALGPAAAVVPLALHVDYWDYIGWKDAYAQGSFGERQSWLVRANRHKMVYTPQFFVGGTELRSWRGALPDRVRQLNGLPAAAEVRIQASLAPGGALALNAEATTRAGAGPAALYLALTESGLASKVTRGENRGATLAHDHVVREWIGPIRLLAGTAWVQREIALPAAWNRARLEVVAFVQDERSGSVLQALSAQRCAGP
ncbi:MAG: DUF1223 domain-containing protein [Betaproteobacteria bacterium]|nr:DUF1223 domain-containing protein [Betaproteobacteria bacterium]